MERNLGFFDAWRAKKRERRNEEVTSLEKMLGRKTEYGMFSRFLRMEKEEVSVGGSGETRVQENLERTNETIEVTSEKNESNRPAERTELTETGVDIARSIKPFSIQDGGKPNGLPSHLTDSQSNRTEDTSPDAKYTSVEPKPIAANVRRKSNDTKSPADSRRSSVVPDSRKSSIASSLASFTNIQEKIQALSKDSSQTDFASKKAPKVNKLTDEAFKIVKEPPVKTKNDAKVSPQVESKLGETSGVNESENSEKVGTETDINIVKATTVGVEEEKPLMKNVKEIESEPLTIKRVETGEKVVKGSEVVQDSKTGVVSRENSETVITEIKNSTKVKKVVKTKSGTLKAGAASRTGTKVDQKATSQAEKTGKDVEKSDTQSENVKPKDSEVEKIQPLSGVVSKQTTKNDRKTEVIGVASKESSVEKKQLEAVLEPKDSKSLSVVASKQTTQETVVSETVSCISENNTKKVTGSKVDKTESEARIIETNNQKVVSQCAEKKQAETDKDEKQPDNVEPKQSKTTMISKDEKITLQSSGIVGQEATKNDIKPGVTSRTSKESSVDKKQSETGKLETSDKKYISTGNPNEKLMSEPQATAKDTARTESKDQKVASQYVEKKLVGTAGKDVGKTFTGNKQPEGVETNSTMTAKVEEIMQQSSGVVSKEAAVSKNSDRRTSKEALVEKKQSATKESNSFSVITSKREETTTQETSGTVSSKETVKEGNTSSEVQTRSESRNIEAEEPRKLGGKATPSIVVKKLAKTTEKKSLTSENDRRAVVTKDEGKLQANTSKESSVEKKLSETVKLETKEAKNVSVIASKQTMQETVTSKTVSSKETVSENNTSNKVRVGSLKRNTEIGKKVEAMESKKPEEKPTSSISSDTGVKLAKTTEKTNLTLENDRRTVLAKNESKLHADTSKENSVEKKLPETVKLGTKEPKTFSVILDKREEITIQETVNNGTVSGIRKNNTGVTSDRMYRGEIEARAEGLKKLEEKATSSTSSDTGVKNLTRPTEKKSLASKNDKEADENKGLVEKKQSETMKLETKEAKSFSVIANKQTTQETVTSGGVENNTKEVTSKANNIELGEKKVKESKKLEEQSTSSTSSEAKKLPKSTTNNKKSNPTTTQKETHKRELVKEALKIQESMTILTNQANQILEEEDKNVQKLLKKTSCKIDEDISETSYKSQDTSGSESISLRKDQRKILKKLKVKTNPDECYPKTQKLLTGKPINAFEEANFEESKRETVVSPTKVEAFLRETLNPPVVGSKEPVKTMEAVVEEIVTSTSEKSKYEKPVQKQQVKYSSRGEVILGVVSIKPNVDEKQDNLSAITLVPAFRPEKSIFDKEEKNERTSDYFSESPENVKKIGADKMADIVEDARSEIREETNRERSPFSPVSDFSDDSYDHYIASVDYSLNTSSYDNYSRYRSLRSTSTPRRIFPQVAVPSAYRSYKAKEDSPVVFDAGLSFDLSSNRTSLRHSFKPQPAFLDRKTSSNSLSVRIADFLKRTDHIMDEWKYLGKGGNDDLQSLVELPSKKILGHPSSKCKSATNIMIKGLLNYSKGNRASSSIRSRSTARTSENSDRTISDIDELSEMTMDLSEERAASTAQAERLEAETAERVRLEQELSQIQSEKKNLQQTSERLEMELFYARADVNGLSESEADLEDGGGDAALYKNKCERAMRELEFTRRRLQQQHEDDLEQLVGLKKQLEKKLTDAYEEIEEQRQVAGQWKRKVQKLQSEMNDLRLLLEEQSSRNNLLEKKQRKFDSEIQMLQEELRSEKNQKERLSREKEMAVAEKYSLEQNLSSVRLELELKDEKVTALMKELEELTRGGGTEQEVTQLRKSKHDLEMKLKEQEEELDELAGQVSMLEGNKLRLEMSLESLRKEHRREMAQRDDELDEARSNANKKIKVLESQLESEHEERTLLVREKHELERRLADAEERGRHYRAVDEDALQRARRDLKKTKALLRDTQVMLERAKQDSPSKAALRALKNQLEDAELARASAVKAKQSLESELNEVSGQLEEALRAKGDAENRCQAALRETNALRTQVDENEEELAELLKKYRQTVQQLSAEQLANQETAGALAEAEAERSSLRDQLAELTAKLEANSIVDPMSGLAQKKLEIRIKELESRLELEQTTRGRLEVQITRLKENVERLSEDCVQARTKEQAAADLTRKLQRSLREAKEELVVQQSKEQEAAHKRKELEKRLESAEQEASTARTDLRLAVKRIEDLQSAISGEIGSDSERSESDEEDSGDDSIISHVPSTLSSTSRTSRTPDLTPR